MSWRPPYPEGCHMTGRIDCDFGHISGLETLSRSTATGAVDIRADLAARVASTLPGVQRRPTRCTTRRLWRAVGVSGVAGALLNRLYCPPRAGATPTAGLQQQR